ncbi:MAG: signal peptide peptidase SppA [Thermodesulfobacteriota bacterium]|nr:MAG: signal peptide peptidase SppA [Thermodesulfobacteriota bacterium]
MSFVKNLLAVLGAVFLAFILLAIVISLTLKGGLGYGEKVAIVSLEGVIKDPTEISRQLIELGDREDIKAVVVRINSPGGAVGPSQEIYSGIKRLARKKPVVASMGAVAASGGYYAATAAEKIVANPGTITGAIGVLIEFVNASELLKKIGVQGYVIKSGRFKDTGSPFRKMESADKEMIQRVLNDINSQFIEAVAEGRGLKINYVRKIADGRIFSGAQAKSNGLVDELGDLADAIELSAKLAGIKGKPEVIYPEKRPFGLWQALTGARLPDRFTELFTGLRVMYLMDTP